MIESYFFKYQQALESLHSCAIENNPWAIEMLELKKEDPKKFHLELIKSGLIDMGNAFK